MDKTERDARKWRAWCASASRAEMCCELAKVVAFVVMVAATVAWTVCVVATALPSAELARTFPSAVDDRNRDRMCARTNACVVRVKDSKMFVPYLGRSDGVDWEPYAAPNVTTTIAVSQVAVACVFPSAIMFTVWVRCVLRSHARVGQALASAYAGPFFSVFVAFYAVQNIVYGNQQAYSPLVFTFRLVVVCGVMIVASVIIFVTCFVLFLDAFVSTSPAQTRTDDARETERLVETVPTSSARVSDNV